MEFVTNENQIKCIRTVLTDGGKIKKKFTVVSFDDNQEIIPPHAAASLTQSENRKLQDWLHERALLIKKLDDESVEETVLDTLPDLLTKAKLALEDIDGMDFDLFKRLKVNLRELDERLNRFHSIVEDGKLELESLQPEEILKEKLDNIKANL